jgi:hypothetical protein
MYTPLSLTEPIPFLETVLQANDFASFDAEDMKWNYICWVEWFQQDQRLTVIEK